MTARLFRMPGQIYVALAVFISGLLFSNLVYGQATVINFSADCGNARSLARLLSEYDETASLTMTSIRDSESGEIKKNVLVLFINYKTKTWTMAERISPDLFCIIATGDDVNPYVKKEHK
jgi:hypothetical protein